MFGYSKGQIIRNVIARAGKNTETKSCEIDRSKTVRERNTLILQKYAFTRLRTEKMRTNPAKNKYFSIYNIYTCILIIIFLQMCFY